MINANRGISQVLERNRKLATNVDYFNFFSARSLSFSLSFSIFIVGRTDGRLFLFFFCSGFYLVRCLVPLFVWECMRVSTVQPILLGSAKPSARVRERERKHNKICNQIIMCTVSMLGAGGRTEVRELFVVFH